MAKTVLVVDDEPIHCEVLRKFLTGKGFHVTTAHDGDQALAVYKQHRPDVVLLDIRMPGKDGVETLHELKELDPEAKVIMVTAVHEKKVADQALAEGALDYITKPLTLPSLQRALETVVSSLSASA